MARALLVVDADTSRDSVTSSVSPCHCITRSRSGTSVPSAVFLLFTAVTFGEALGEFMVQYQIAVLVGSLRRDSYNRRLAAAIAKLAPQHLSLKQLKIDDLPLYNQDDDSNQAQSVQRLKSEIKASQGIIFVTPEYNRSVPGVLKNAIDHAARPYGQSAWEKKPAGVLGASVGQIGTAVAQQHLRCILACLDMPTLGLPEVFLKVDDGSFDQGGAISNPELLKFLQGWMDRYVAWVDIHAR
jgi:chromate reductase, NAD(P)H dehydrogenase (quinone)